MEWGLKELSKRNKIYKNKYKITKGIIQKRIIGNRWKYNETKEKTEESENL